MTPRTVNAALAVVVILLSAGLLVLAEGPTWTWP